MSSYLNTLFLFRAYEHFSPITHAKRRSSNCFFTIFFLIIKSTTTLTRVYFTFIRPYFLQLKSTKIKVWQEKKSNHCINFKPLRRFSGLTFIGNSLDIWKQTINTNRNGNNMNTKVLNINLRSPSEGVYTLAFQGQHAIAQVNMTCEIST